MIAGGLLAFDPGVHRVGFAWFDDGQLYRAALWRADLKNSPPIAQVIHQEICSLHDAGVWDGGRAAIECPAYVWRGEAKDSIDVALVAGRLAQSVHTELTTDVRVLAPRSWKGTVDPEVMLARIVKKLGERELVTLYESGAPAGLMHNVIDAVGIGLHQLGRL